MIAMLICNTRTFDIEFNVYAIPFAINGKEFTSNGNWSRVRVLCIVATRTAWAGCPLVGVFGVFALVARGEVLGCRISSD